MKDLDKLIKNTKADVPPLPGNFSQLVLKKIETEGVEIAHYNRWINLESIMLIAALFLAGLGVFTSNLLLYEIKTNGVLELLYFGTDFLFDLIQYIPFDMVFTVIVILTLTTWTLKRSKIAKIGVIGITAISILFSGFGGAAMAISNLNENVQKRLAEKKYDFPFVSRFYNDRAKFKVRHPHFQFGEILEVKTGKLIVKNPFGDKVEVKISDVSHFEKGQVIRLKGEFSNNMFHANMYQHCDKKRVGRYFRMMGHGKGHMKHMMKYEPRFQKGKMRGMRRRVMMNI